MLKKLLLALALVFMGAALTPQKAEAAVFGPGVAGIEQAAPAAINKAYYVYRYRYRPRRDFVRRAYRPTLCATGPRP